MRRYQTAVALSAGGTAEVYRAWDAKLERQVALKFLRWDDPSLVERMFREARAQARLDHEGICKVYDVGELDGRPYIAMQFIDGVELGELAGELTLEERVQVLQGVAEAVHHANQAGIVHRDLKPSNIMVRRQDDGLLRPVVVDFGLVHEHADDGTAVTQQGQVLGTPPYLAPEQVEGERDRLDRRTDVYGLGATFYELLTGRPPFESDRSVDLLVKILQDEPVAPRKLDPSLPLDLETIALKAMEKEPQRRFESARALAEDLGRYLDGEPIQARPSSFGYRLSKKARKHSGAVKITSAILVGAVVMLAVVLWRAEKRLDYEQHFAQIGRDLTWSLRAVYMSAHHDIRPSKEKAQTRIEQLEQELRSLGKLGRAPAHFAIGQGYAALQEDERAREHLQAAWREGYRTPEVGYFLGLVLGRLYDRRLAQIRHLRDEALRREAIDELRSGFRDPALEFLAVGRGVDSVAVEYVEALLAYYERRLDDSLHQLALARAKLPWLYETYLVEGLVLSQKADDLRSEGGDLVEARALYERSRRAYQAAIESGGSDPRSYLGLCGVFADLMRLELQRPSGSMESYRQAAFESCDQALAIDGHLARAHRMSAGVRSLWARKVRLSAGDPLPILAAALSSAYRAVALEPDRAPGYAVVGQVLAERAEHFSTTRTEDPRQDIAEAIDHLDRALGLRPGNPVFLNSMGTLWFMRASYEYRHGYDPEESLNRGVAALESALEERPRSFDLHHNMGNLLSLRCNQHFDAGLDYSPCLERTEGSYRRSAELNPEMDWAHLEVASVRSQRAMLVFMQGGDPEPLLADAQDWIDSTLAINPQKSEAYNRQVALHLQHAYIALLEGQNPTARLRLADEALARAVKLRPDAVMQHARGLERDILALRWALVSGEPVASALASADHHLEQLLEQPVRDSWFYLVTADYLAWKAYALQRADVSAERVITTGAELVEDAIAHNIEPVLNVGMRGVFQLLASSEAEPDRRLFLLKQAEANLLRSVELNRWYSLDFDPWLDQTQRALGRGPQVPSPPMRPEDS